MDRAVILLQYISLVVLVIFSANRASKYVDELDQKTSLGGALLGGILLAGITSLPEFITTIFSATSLGKPGMAFGNIFGSIIFNITGLVIVDLWLLKKKYFNKGISSLSNIKINLTVLICHCLILIPIFIEKVLGFDINIWGITKGHVSFISIAIIILYALGIKKLINEGSSEEEESVVYEDINVKKYFTMMIIWAVVLVAASMLMTSVTDKLSVEFNIGSSVAGALFLGVATSLPELTAVFTLVIRGNKNAAVANVVGSNLFNLVILSLVDLIIPSNIYGTLMHDNTILKSVVLLIVFCSVNMLFLNYLLKRKPKKNLFLYSVPSILILSNYILYITLSVVMFNV